MSSCDHLSRGRSDEEIDSEIFTELRFTTDDLLKGQRTSRELIRFNRGSADDYIRILSTPVRRRSFQIIV